MADKIPMTKLGFDKLEEELKFLKGTERPAIIKAIAEAREHGDLSENAEYHAARERQSFVEGRVMELEHKISHADVIDVSKLEGNDIKFGATITLIDDDSEEEVIYQIVGEDESNIKAGLLSVNAPLSRALIGKKPKETVEVSTPKGGKSYEIVKVAYR